MSTSGHDPDGRALADGAGAPGEPLPPELGLARLPRGRHGLPREFVAHNHRERLIAGLAAAVAARGFAATTIADITREAAVSRRTFYEHFGSKEECFDAAYDVVMDRIAAHVRNAFRAQDEWPLAMRGALTALLEYLEREPAFAWLIMVEGMRAGAQVQTRYSEAIDAFAAILRRGRFAAPRTLAELPESTEEALVGGVASLITRRILAEGADRLTELTPDVVAFALTPYIGRAEAERIALGRTS